MFHVDWNGDGKVGLMDVIASHSIVSEADAFFESAAGVVFWILLTIVEIALVIIFFPVILLIVMLTS